MSAAERKHEFVDVLRRQQIEEGLAADRRLDGRKANETRELSIEVGPVVKANGSALVRLGNTAVMVGVKILQGTPFPDTPDQGVLTVNADVLPISSPYEEPGPPDEDTIELARVVDRGIRESHMVDMKELAVEPGKKVYAVFVDVAVLDVDGNLFDATSYAAVTALASARFKKVSVKDGEVVQMEEMVKLPVSTIPVSVTAGKVGEFLFLDPTGTEEAVMEARMTTTFDSEDNLCATQKGGEGFFTPEEVLRQMEVARAKAKEIRAKIKEAVKNAGKE
ncbi:MAG: exosome complex protein Rrp42 [Nitrososphaerota archaeon]|nr:exosome complex protein Rrp42 [Nitrososphaerota archaeon]MDG6939561.1 exosome complex protein Rrp42 [Nitrososphaerota archaeon]